MRVRLSAWNCAAAAVLLLAAPVAGLLAAANAGGAAPHWAKAANGFRLAAEAKRRVTGDPDDLQAGVSLAPGAVDLARAAYAREPLASDALFVLALSQAPRGEVYRANAPALLGAKLDQRNALLQLLLIADAASREDFATVFRRADILAAAHPQLARAVLIPVFESLDDPAAIPIISAGLAEHPRWAEIFTSSVPREQQGLRNYLALRREVGWTTRWPSDEDLVGALAAQGLYPEALAAWRGITGPGADPLAFVTDSAFAPVGWRLAERGDRVARVAPDGALLVTVERGTGGELARQLVDLAPGRYRLETQVEAGQGDGRLWAALECAATREAIANQQLAPRTEFTVAAPCPVHWLIVGGSALESRHRLEARISDWRLVRAD